MIRILLAVAFTALIVGPILLKAQSNIAALQLQLQTLERD